MEAKRHDLFKHLAAAQAAASELQKDLHADASFRAEVTEASNRLTRTLQTPVDRAWELLNQWAHPAVLQVALDAGWLHLINSNDAGITADQLAEHTASDAGLVKRLMRVLTSNGIICESATNKYAPSPFSKLFDAPEWANGLRHALRDYSITMAGMPGYFAQKGYRLDVREHIYQHVHGVPFLERVKQGGEVGMQFTSFMRVVRAGKRPWFDVYPVAERLKVSCDADLLLVDVGGGSGHDLMSFSHAKKELGLQGAMVLQDVPSVLAHVPEEYRDTIDVQPYDFFTPQKVVGARAYMLKHILHDWSDEDGVSILTHVRDAMKVGYSKMLINEIVLPDRDCDPWVANFDITMMAVVGGRERSASEWEGLIHKVGGLVLEKIWKFGSNNESIIELVREL
jgi:hypothetical protein